MNLQLIFLKIYYNLFKYVIKSIRNVQLTTKTLFRSCVPSLLELVKFEDGYAHLIKRAITKSC